MNKNPKFVAANLLKKNGVENSVIQAVRSATQLPTGEYQIGKTDLVFSLSQEGEIEKISVNKQDKDSHDLYLVLTKHLVNPFTEVVLCA